MQGGMVSGLGFKFDSIFLLLRPALVVLAAWFGG